MTRLIPLLIFLCPFVLSSQIENYSGGLPGQKMDWMFHYLTKYYVNEVDNDTLAELAIKRIIEELDPFSVYQSKEEVEAQKEADKGYYPKAAGFNFYMLYDTALVTYISSKGPAEIAGLRRGDQILSVYGLNVIGDYKQLSSLIDGKDSDDLKLKVKRGKEILDIELKKDRVPWLSIPAAYMVDNRIGYIKLAKFTLNTMEEFYPTIRYLQSSGMQELVLDLRGNPGGVKDQALALADEFLPAGKLVFTQSGFNSEKEEYTTSKEGVWETGKLTVLQDSKTASASEIFIGAMRDWDRAVLLGHSTYGKGLIQQSYGLGDGSNIRLTVGRYVTPVGQELLRRSYDSADAMEDYKEALYNNSFTKDLTVPESLKGKSKGGRAILIGNDGIIPDLHYDPPANETTLLDELVSNGHLYKFSTSYLHQHRAEMKKEYNTVSSFLNDKIREAFVRKELREYLKYNTPSIQLPADFSEELVHQLRMWMSSQLWHDNAYYQVKNSKDKTMYRAIEVCQGKVHDILGISY